MSFSTTLTASVTSGAQGYSPFPPDYEGEAVGYISGVSNPSNGDQGSLSIGTYLGATIAAICQDQLAPANFMVALQGTYDQEFIGAVTFTGDNGALSFDPTQATYEQQEVNGVEITLWTWPLATSAFSNSTNYTISIANTGDTPITLTAVSPSSTEIDVTWNDSLSNVSGVLWYQIWAAVNSSTLSLLVDNIAPAAMPMEHTFSSLQASTQYTYEIRAILDSGEDQYYLSNVVQAWTPASGISASFNCDCESVPPIPENQTLAQLRTRLATRLGYAAQAANLPPGAAALFNEFLLSAQNQLYRTFREKRIERFWAWQMEINQRYYGLAQDESDCKSIDQLNITWLGFEDLNLAWYPLIEGIDPVMYTRAQISTGWPTHYEIRSCIEIFPAPKSPYTLWAKGLPKLNSFVNDTDYATIDSELVLLLALGLGKTHYGQPDANACMTQANNYLMKLVALSHRTARFVPRTRQNTLLTPPLFLPTIEPGGGS